MNRRLFLTGVAAFSLSGCTTSSSISTYGSPEMLEIRQQLMTRVEALPDSKSKSVSLALLNRPETQFYIDEHNLPAARWRGADDLGSCVHVRPDTQEIYLENQYARANRKSKVPKYIQFDHKGPWHSRRHNSLDKIRGTEKNWIDANSETDGQALLDELLAALT